MSALMIVVMETQHVTTQLDLSRVCVIEDLPVMDLIVQVCTTTRERYCDAMSIQDN